MEFNDSLGALVSAARRYRRAHGSLRFGSILARLEAAASAEAGYPITGPQALPLRAADRREAAPVEG